MPSASSGGADGAKVDGAKTDEADGAPAAKRPRLFATADPMDVAFAILFLASNEAAAITGADWVRQGATRVGTVAVQGFQQRQREAFAEGPRESGVLVNVPLCGHREGWRQPRADGVAQQQGPLRAVGSGVVGCRSGPQVVGEYTGACIYNTALQPSCASFDAAAGPAGVGSGGADRRRTAGAPKSANWRRGRKHRHLAEPGAVCCRWLGRHIPRWLKGSWDWISSPVRP